MKRRIIKKRMRIDELYLRDALINFLKSPLPVFENQLEDNILSIRWAIYGLTYYHLKFDPVWSKRDMFLELVDIDSIELISDPQRIIQVIGQFTWMPQGKDAKADVWWAMDRIPEMGKYGAVYMKEPFVATIQLLHHRRSPLKYSFAFGIGSTSRLFTNKLMDTRA
ncbi:MAG: hypothetical protein HY231_12155 [Acidobacteria bacterium]|nr:hypothetical protein [Acidobacteriota bacterium]